MKSIAPETVLKVCPQAGTESAMRPIPWASACFQGLMKAEPLDTIGKAGCKQSCMADTLWVALFLR